MLAEATREERIVGGNNSKFGSWPWQVLRKLFIQQNKTKKQNNNNNNNSYFRVL